MCTDNRARRFTVRVYKNMRSSSSLYLSRLDHLRFFAAALVLIFHHFHQFVPFTRFNNPFASLINEGHVGIGLFMVLSGFIFSVLTAGKTVRYRQFLFNRFVRIYPLYVFAVVFAVTLMVYHKQLERVGAFEILQWLLLFRPPTITEIWQFSHLWTIPVEFSFYVLFPFLHLFFQRKGVWYFLGLMALMLVLRIGVFFEYGSVRFLAYETLFGRLDQFLLGYIAGRLYVDGYGERVLGHPLALAGSAVMALNMVWLHNQLGGSINMEAWWWTVWPPFEGMIWATLVLSYLSQRWSLPSRLDYWLAQGGVLSFSLYVCHPFVISVISPRVGVISFSPNDLFNVVATGLIVLLPASLGVALMLNRLIEKPFLDFRKSYVMPRPPLTGEDRYPPACAPTRGSNA